MTGDFFAAGESLAEAIESMLADGFELPIYFAAIGRNGSMVCGQYTQAEVGLKAEFLAERIQDEGLETPMHIMFVDSRGEVGKVSFTRPDGDDPS
jgi:hypothetical protein